MKRFLIKISLYSALAMLAACGEDPDDLSPTGSSSSSSTSSSSSSSTSSSSGSVPRKIKSEIEAEEYNEESPSAPFSAQTDSGRTIMVWPGEDASHLDASDAAEGQLFYSVIPTTDSITLYATVNFPSIDDDSFHYKLDGKDSSWILQNSVSTAGYEEIEISTWNDLTIGKLYTFKIQRREDGAKIDSLRVEGASFSTTIEADLQLGKNIYDSQCLKCHGDDGKSPFDITVNVLALDAMIHEVEIDMPKGSPEDCDNDCSVHVSNYIKYVLLEGTPDIQTKRRPVAARMIKPHYINTIRDLFNVSLTDEQKDLIPVELISEKGFITAFDSQQLITPHIESFIRLSRFVSEQVNIRDLSERLADCNVLEENPSCLSVYIKELGLRVFRQPINTTDQDRLEELFQSVSGFSNTNREDAAKAVLRAVLQSPQFLYRFERETEGARAVRTLNGYELASRLSYFLWQSTPDDGLLQFAAEMESSGFNEARLKTQVERMLANEEKIARPKETFWLDYTLSSTSAILGANKQEAEELRRSVVETALRVSGKDSTEAPLQDLFTTNDMILTPTIAASLGLPSKGSGYRVYDTSDLPQRAGLLSHPGFIANIGSTSFVARGTIMTEKVLCREITGPPAGISDAIDDTAEETLDFTPRQASDYRFNLGGACTACHSTFEPIAFAFEQLDVFGNYSTTDNIGRSLFSTGYLQGKGGSVGPSYDNVPELMTILSDSEEASECFSRNMMKFAVGRSYAAHADSDVEIAHERHINDGGTFTALLRAVAMNPLFRTLYVIEK